MQEITKEITKEEYDKLQSMDYKEQEAYLLPDGIPDAWMWGYGYYGHSVFHQNGKYYRQFNVGSSCD